MFWTAHAVSMQVYCSKQAHLTLQCIEREQAHVALQVVPSTLTQWSDEAVPVWPAGVCDPMMAALPTGRLLLARIKHIPGPQASPALRSHYGCLHIGGLSLFWPCDCGGS